MGARTRTSAPAGRPERSVVLGGEDSNPQRRDQNPLCYLLHHPRRVPQCYRLAIGGDHFTGCTSGPDCCPCCAIPAEAGIHCPAVPSALPSG